MPKPGWKYLRLGECADCSESKAFLYVPVLQGTPTETHPELVSGEHIPHFEPVCSSCRAKYNLDDLCAAHHLPTIEMTGMCDKCISKPNPPS